MCTNKHFFCNIIHHSKFIYNFVHKKYEYNFFLKKEKLYGYLIWIADFSSNEQLLFSRMT